ncbi:MAG: hypothetical protein Q9227_007237 [Pyrenula ochraceoflavens]
MRVPRDGGPGLSVAPYPCESQFFLSLKSLQSSTSLATPKMQVQIAALSALLSVAALIPAAGAQTWSYCNPMNKTDCAPNKALGVSNYTMDFTTQTPSSKVWNATAGTVNYGDDGAEFTIAQKMDSPTIQSNWYIFFGSVSVIMKAAPGRGVISSIVLESDDLDEVDWEFMGGNSTHVETNYFGKGNTSTFDRAIYYPVDNPQDNWHNYTVTWSSDAIGWWIDGQQVRELKYDDAVGGTQFPQTPMNVRLGIWPGGDPKEPKGTIEWAGGEIDYDKTPYTMTVKSLTVDDASRGTAYQYGDKTGSWQSIKVLNTTDEKLPLDGNQSKSPTQNAQQKWNGLSQTAKISIGASVAGVALIGAAVMAIYCIKQRKLGRHERHAADLEYEKRTQELLSYRAEMQRTRTMNLNQGIPLSSGGRGGYSRV